jgi:cytochrome c553
VPLTYGGAISKQAFLVRVPGRQGLYPLFQYHLAGKDARYDLTRRDYRDFDVSAFWDAGAQLLRDPAPDTTFEARCAGCHFTGYEAFAGSGGERLARAVSDPAGAFDIDGDSQPDEINIGCESCHGPGSQHVSWAANPANAPHAARYIVAPEHLSPSRQLMICSRCHDQVVGAGTVPSEAPLDAQDKMPVAGISRAAFLASHVTVKGPAPTNLWSQGNYSRTEHHQAADFLRSPKYRNDRILVTCQDCHSNHGEARALHQLLHDHTDPASLLCFRCHNLDHLDHMQTTTGSTHAGIGTVCARCHMPATARGGAGTPGIQFGPLTGTVADDDLIYYRGDRTSHLFGALPRRAHPDVAGEQPTRAMPIPFTDGCGQGCHDATPLPFSARTLVKPLEIGPPDAR